MTGDWRPHAACQGEDLELFFGPDEGGHTPEQIAAAKAVCMWCPVRAECLAEALETRSDYGVWGGLTGDERLALRRQQQAQSRTRLPAGKAARGNPEDRWHVLDSGSWPVCGYARRLANVKQLPLDAVPAARR